jgi:3-dehydroquinate dehydratase-2
MTLAKRRILVLNGPNLNLLGRREPSIYGAAILADLEAELVEAGASAGVDITCRQSNHEGELVTLIQEAGIAGTDVILNAGALTHTSIALADAIKGSGARVIEVHISNVHARESFRHHSYLSPVAAGIIVGFGTMGYRLALQALLEMQPAR